MVKKNKRKVPKEILGFKLSGGTRKDLRKLMKMLTHPDKRAIAATVGTGLATFLLERIAHRTLDRQRDGQIAH
jgi:hypothetical protein